MSDSDEIFQDTVGDGADDLFGDGDEEDEKLDELPESDISDDDNRDHRSPSEQRHAAGGYGSDEEPQRNRQVIASMNLIRHRTPKIKDGEIQQMRVPRFLKFMPVAYDRTTFEPSEWDIENETSEASKEVIRFYNDADTGEMKSNANVYRWSDGSLTVSVGDQHYPINKKVMAPPANKAYNENDDSHTYAAAAHLSSGLFLVVGHVSEEYTVSLTKDLDDDARQKLAMRYRQSQAEDGTIKIIKTTHDPELQRKQAELAEKERLRAQRKRENAAARMEGGPRAGRGGLSIDDLEGSRRGAAAGRKRGAPGGGKAKRRRDDYDSDDDRPDGARKEDYDLADDFIAPSDEEISEEEDEEEEELLDDEDERPRSKKQKTSDVDEEEDAEGDMDDDVPAHHKDAGRNRRRHVIDDDEE